MTSAASVPPPFVAEKVTKAYPGHVALDKIDLEIPAGHVIGLLGRNGAGFDDGRKLFVVGADSSV